MFSLLSLPAASSSPSRCQGTIQTTGDNDGSDRKVLGKGELVPCTLLKITKMSLVASIPFVRSMKIDDRDEFC